MHAWKELQYVNCYRMNGVKMTRRTTTRKKKKKMGGGGGATCSHNENVFSSKMNMATTGQEQKAATGLASNEKPRYCWLNSDKMDGSDENGMVKKWRLEFKMAERSEEQHGNPSS